MSDRWIILPFDGSEAARASLRRASRCVVNGRGLYAGIVVATAGVEQAALDAAVQDARACDGATVPIEIHLLDPVDPGWSFHELVGALPQATLAAPLGSRGRAPWYREACRPSRTPHTMVLFFLTPEELAYEAQHSSVPGPAVARLAAALRAGVRLILRHAPTARAPR